MNEESALDGQLQVDGGVSASANGLRDDRQLRLLLPHGVPSQASSASCTASASSCIVNGFWMKWVPVVSTPSVEMTLPA